MIYSDRSLAVLLFGGFFALNHGKLLSPRNWIMSSTSRLLLRANEAIGSNTHSELVVRGTSDFATDKWRSFKTVYSARKSEAETDECEMEIVNNSNSPVLLCWINGQGELKNYYPIYDKSIRDGSVPNIHLEYTHVGHAFICIKQSVTLPKNMKDVTPEDFLFCFRPMKGMAKFTLTLSTERKRKFLRVRDEFSVTVDVSSLSHTANDIISTVDKVYHTKTMHGFTIHYEPDVFECVPMLESILSTDLSVVNKLLPKVACGKLQASTPMWINKSITFGTVKHPVRGTAATYHPLGGKDWLRKNGLNDNKEGSVEFFCAESHLNSRVHWGDGGVILHEYCHAYHNKYCPDGYDCEEIREAYNIAMDRKLYENCRVHGPQGGPDGTKTLKAYACANCMEFFAELSVAYHWTEDSTTEYNKWFPFNRAQLLKHDPDTFRVLDKHWHILDGAPEEVSDNNSSE